METEVLPAGDQPASRGRLSLDQSDALEGLLQHEIVVDCCGKLIAAPLLPQSIRDQLKDSGFRG